MKKQTGIWIDSSKAIIVTLSGGGVNVEEIDSDFENLVFREKEGDKGSFMGSHHINKEKKFDERKKHVIDGFLRNVIEKVKQNEELYIFGPSETKLRLFKLIEKVDHLSDRVKSVESSDRMTRNQLVAKVMRFYEIESKHTAN